MILFIEKICILTNILSPKEVFSYIAFDMILDTPNYVNEIHSQEVLETELGTIRFYNNLVVMEAKEDVTISFRTGIFILLKVIYMVGTKPVIYISNRKNRYSVDPNDYKYLDMIPNLKGIGIISYKYGLQSSELERRFINKPFATFHDLESAEAWARQTLSLQEAI